MGLFRQIWQISNPKLMKLVYIYIDKVKSEAELFEIMDGALLTDVKIAAVNRYRKISNTKR